MFITTRGIVLRQVKYSGSSLIVKIFTEKSGIRSFIFKGVRKHGARVKASLFQPLSLIELTCRSEDGGRLGLARDIIHLGHGNDFGNDVIKSSLALFIDEVICRAVKEEEANTDLFDFLFRTVMTLQHAEGSLSGFHVAFMTALSRRLGFAPGGSCSPGKSFFDMREGIFTAAPPAHPDYMNRHQAGSLDICRNCGFPEEYSQANRISGKQELLERIIEYYRLHLPGFGEVKSLQVLREVFGT